jgi:hypothetical protein
LSRSSRRACQCRRHQDLGRIVQLPVGQPRPRAALDAEAGLEWAWRIWLEPRRLFWRYLTTNPRALYLLFNKSRPSGTDRAARLT